VVDSVIAAGFQGVQNGLNSARQAAQDIAKATTTPVSSTADQDLTMDITQAAVELKISELQVQASAEVIKTGDEVIGSLLSIKA
jgi:hypothetical protein